jgi:hypothetical protein
MTNISSDAVTATIAQTTPARSFNRQPDPPGFQPVVDVGFDINQFRVAYSLGLYTTAEYKQLRSPDYHVMPKTQPGNPGFDALSPYNTPLTPFLIPSAAKMFGGQLSVFSHSSIPVYWTVRSQFVTQGNVALTQSPSGANFFDTQPGAVIPQGGMGLCGYLAILATHPWSFQPDDLPLHEPVHLQDKLHVYSDGAFANELTDATPADDVIGIWVMRTR